MPSRREVLTEHLGAPQVDVLDVGARKRRLGVHEDTDSARERSLDIHLLRAQQRNIHQAEVTGARSREGAGEIRSCRQHDADEVVSVEAIALEDCCEEFVHGSTHLIGVIR